ncbi:hypothetical protein AUI06_11315 [archaeon 13_2_20CM_2_52_21]|nr:MAG: hypothetical protein AUI06_11315 [archaeon 13_2_20CM_2_52_21]
MTIPSIVFPFENASDQEILARRIVEMGLNAIRISFAPYCTNPNGFMSPYNSTRLDRAIRIGQSLGVWIIVDYHGYHDLSNSTVAGCWLSFWRNVLTDFSFRYEKIIWEPLNEPMNINENVTFLGNYYQNWINQARAIGDTHWIVVQNLCSFECNLCPSGNGDCPAAVNGYPRVTDPLDRVFISLHTYMSYNVYHNSWNNTGAEDLARNYYFTMINGTILTGFPILNTEGGPGPTQTTFSNGTKISCPDLVTTGAAGYCATNLHFIKSLTALLEAHTPQAINWIWWPAGDWSTTPKATQLGAISPNSWGTLIPWQPLPTYSLSISTTSGGTTLPGAGDYTYLSGTAVNVTAIPEGGYTFRAWQDNATGLPASDHVELSMSVNQNLVAVFSPILHDVAIENLSPEGSLATSGGPTQVVVTVRDLGDVAETFNVTLYVNNTNVGSQLVRDLGKGSSVTLSFSWDTTGLRPGTYLLKMAASPVSGETALANNNLTIGVNLPSHPNTNSPTALPASLGSAIFMGTAGFTTIILGMFLIRRRLR